MAEAERYILKDAAELLGVSVSALYKWLGRAGLRETVEQQVDEGDNRARYLTWEQLEQLAKIHRRLNKIGTAMLPERTVIQEFQMEDVTVRQFQGMIILGPRELIAGLYDRDPERLKELLFQKVKEMVEGK